ncbi:MAG TPA: ATP-binding protein [Kofleriaceae bacterium]|nr:ATP-binding protein [Kofleriaceae bacterium]
MTRSFRRRTLALAQHHAAIIDADRVYFVATAESREATRVELADTMDLTAVGEEFWVVAGASPRLHRFDPEGGRLAAPVALGDGMGVLRSTATGPPGAVWGAESPVIVAADGTVTPIVGDLDAVIPVSLGRWVICRRERVALRDVGTERWRMALAGGSHVLDGAALFDGRCAALIVGRDATPSQLVVISLHDGSIQHRVTLAGIELVRFAAARGYVLLRSGPRTLILFDLRFGRVLEEHVESRDIVDAALDHTGRSFVVRYGDAPDDVAFGVVRDLVAAGTRVAVAADGLAPVDPIAAAPAGGTVVAEPLVALPADRPDRPEFHRGHAALAPGVALAPRAPRPSLPPGQATALLDTYRPLIAALVGRAIALAWDCGRIAFPNEGHLPFHGEVHGILGGVAGRAPDEVAGADRRVVAASDAVRAAEAASAATGSPLLALAAEFGLSPVARLVLLLTAAPSLWGELARLYGVLGNDEQRALVDEQLLIQILDGQIDRHAVARELDRDAPLIRHGFIRPGGGRMRPFIELTCEPILLRILKANAPERDLDDVRLVHASCAFDQLLIPVETKQAIAQAIGKLAAPGRIVVRGRAGAGRHTLLAAIAASANRTLGAIDAAPILRDLRARIGQLRTALCRAHLLGLLPCVDGLEALPSDDVSGRDLVAGVLDAHPGPLAVRLPWNSQPIVRPGYALIDLPALSLGQRSAAWDLLLRERGVYVRVPDELAERYAVGPGVVKRVIDRVASSPPAATGAGDGPIDRALDLDRAIRQHLESQLELTATRVTRLTSWARVVLPPDIQESVLELLARIKHRRVVFDTWGFDQVLTTARGVTALFQGPPGTGKTLVASAIANELGMDLYRVDLSRIMSKWIGETEQNLARLFDAAEDGHAIVLFDEADSLFAKRTEVKTSVDRYANLEVNYLLQRLDSFEGIAILTTNFGTAIDGAFKRRLSFRLTFPFPDEEAREALWRSHLPSQLPTHGPLDLAELARRYQLSGGYIRNATVRAAFLAAEEQSPLTQDHLERAIRAEFREIGKIAEAGRLE